MSSPNTKSSLTTLQPQHRLSRAALLVFGVISLVAGVWGGLMRVPVRLPLPVNHANWISFHGPLMVCGFLGTLISLERAAGLRAWWMYLAPLLTAASAAAIAAGSLGPWPRWGMTAGSACFILVCVRILSIQRAMPNIIMLVSAVAWTAGNFFWAQGREISEVVLWWVTFLLLIILGERIELTRFQKPSPLARPWLLAALGVLGAGLAMSLSYPRATGLLAGAALLGFAGWLTRFDFARRTIRHAGLPRFMAICLLSGYVWLLLAGLLVLLKWPQTNGFIYDATLHSFFLGFVFSMIFGHAPVIFPAVLGLPIQFRWTSYLPLVVLHGSVLLRLAGDLTGSQASRAFGAIGNGIAVALFLVNIVISVLLSNFSQARRTPVQQRV